MDFLKNRAQFEFFEEKKLHATVPINNNPIRLKKYSGYFIE
jgi:hypothetical protein